MNKSASELGKLSVKKRFAGLSDEEIAKKMSEVRKKGIDNKKQAQTAT